MEHWVASEHHLFRLDLSLVPNFVCVVEPETWEAVELRWLAPIDLVRLGVKSRDDMYFQPEVLAMAAGPICGVLQCAARAAFWDLPVHALQWLADKRDINVSQCEDEANQVFTLVAQLLPDLSESEHLEIVRLRCRWHEPHLEDFLGFCGFEGLVHAADEQLFEDDREQAQRQNERAKTYEAQVVKLTAAKRATTKKKAITDMRNRHGQRYMNDLPAGEITKERNSSQTARNLSGQVVP